MATTIDMRGDSSDTYPIKITFGREEDYIEFRHKDDAAISIVESDGTIIQVYNDDIDVLIESLRKMKELVEQDA